ILGVYTSTIHRWLNDGFIAGEQITPGAPWQIRITDELRARFVEQVPPGYLPMLEATMKLGVSRQTVLQRVKRAKRSDRNWVLPIQLIPTPCSGRATASATSRITRNLQAT